MSPLSTALETPLPTAKLIERRKTGTVPPSLSPYLAKDSRDRGTSDSDELSSESEVLSPTLQRALQTGTILADWGYLKGASYVDAAGRMARQVVDAVALSIVEGMEDAEDESELVFAITESDREGAFNV